MAIPLSVGTCVLMFLNHLWYSAESLALEERRQTDIVQQLNQVFKQWSVLSGSLLVGVHEKDFEEAVRKQYPWLWYNFFKIKQDTKENPELYQNVLKFEKLCWSEFQAFAGLPHDENEISLDLARQLPKTLGKIYQIRSEAKRILNSEAANLQVMREKQEKSLGFMKLYAYLFAAVNLILAVVLVFLFSRSISSRMQILATNAAVLPQHQIPSNHLLGNDELAYLDKVLTETAKVLHDAAEHRRSILGMVAHDMRSPLMSAQVSIQMIEEIGGDYPDEAYESLEAAADQLSSILKFVQQLLTIQKGEDEGGLQSESTEAPGNGLSAINANMLQESIQSDLPAVNITGSLENQANNKQKVPVLVSTKAILKEFLFRPKIFHQGLLIVMGPLFLQIVFLLFVNQQILVTESLVKGEQRCTDITIGLNIITMDMVRASAAQGIYLLTSSETPHKLASKIFKDVGHEYGKLSNLVGTNNEWSDFIDAARTSTQHTIDKILAVNPSSSIEEKYTTFAEISEVKQRSPEAHRTRQTGNTLFEKNLTLLQQMEAEQTNLARTISSVFGFGIIVNFIVAITVLFFFSKKITSRLNLLVDNASRLGRREDLRKTPPGTDEIAFLGLILQQAKEQIDSASQQRALMMASLAQQMRIPLIEAKAKLDNFAKAADHDLKDSPRKHLVRSQNNIERVLLLVQDLLTMETLETGKVALEVSTCNMQDIVAEALATVSSLARKKGISLSNSCSAISVQADKAKLVQVLINYLSNAIKFSNDNTTISVSSKETAETVSVSVTDQGPGMDKETRDRVFEKFFQAGTEQKAQGFGLGLAICQLIVQSHRGKLGVESELGKGSTFWFEIPRT